MLIPLFNKILAIVGFPQTTLVTPTISMPLEHYRPFNIFSLWAIFSRFISILGVDILKIQVIVLLRWAQLLVFEESELWFS